jgi:mannose-6-phosphate isomerase-like protein (cupin superfamily)
VTPVDIAFARAYHALTMLVASTPALLGFAGWPLALPAQKPARPIPAAEILKAWAEGHTDATLATRDAIRDLTDYADWQLTYTEDEVGQDFLNRYGWFELVGPEGHYRSDEIRAYIAYWGENLYYPWHLHEAEELYFILAGEALFEAEGDDPVTLRPGDIRIHRSNQPHQMTTGDSPVLALVLWRGAGLTGSPRMGTA